MYPYVVHLLMLGCLVGQRRVCAGTKWSGKHSPLHVTGSPAHQPSSPLMKGETEAQDSNGKSGSPKGMVERGFGQSRR